MTIQRNTKVAERNTHTHTHSCQCFLHFDIPNPVLLVTFHQVNKRARQSSQPSMATFSRLPYLSFFLSPSPSDELFANRSWRASTPLFGAALHRANKEKRRLARRRQPRSTATDQCDWRALNVTGGGGVGGDPRPRQHASSGKRERKCKRVGLSSRSLA